MRHSDRTAGRPPAILIAGPTASGKSALALRLAERFDGIVLNADAMQVYRDLRILTARPSEADEARVRHDLFGTIDGASAFSVDLWLRELARKLEEARTEALLPIIVGGTGLYFKALTEGLSRIPAVPADVRDEVRRWAGTRDAPDIHRELAAVDPVMAERLRPSDTQRLVRALEVFRASGRSLAQWQGERAPALLPRSLCRAYVVLQSRDELAQRTERRFNEMMKTGAVDEAVALRARHLDPSLPIMRAIGLRPILRMLDGECSPDQAAVAANHETRQYIKRQLTFARTQLRAFAVSTAAEIEAELTTDLTER